MSLTVLLRKTEDVSESRYMEKTIQPHEKAIKDMVDYVTERTLEYTFEGNEGSRIVRQIQDNQVHFSFEDLMREFMHRYTPVQGSIKEKKFRAINSDLSNRNYEVANLFFVTKEGKLVKNNENRSYWILDENIGSECLTPCMGRGSSIDYIIEISHSLGQQKAAECPTSPSSCPGDSYG